MNDEDFVQKMKDGDDIKGAPIEAIIKAAIAKAISGDTRALDVLFRHGWGNKQVHEFKENPVDRILEKYGLNNAEEEIEKEKQEAKEEKAPDIEKPEKEEIESDKNN